MTKNWKIILGVGIPVIVISGSVGGYFWWKNRTKGTAKKADPNRVAPKKEQFDRLVRISVKKGDDVFEGLTAERAQKMLKLWFKNMSLQDADRLIELTKKQEKDWSPSEKAEWLTLMEKWWGRKIGA